MKIIWKWINFVRKQALNGLHQLGILKPIIFETVQLKKNKIASYVEHKELLKLVAEEKNILISTGMVLMKIFLMQ